MSQSLVQLYTHLIFSTKHRYPFIQPEIREPLRAYFGGILRDLHSPLLSVDCMTDHVHLLYCHSKHLTPIHLVEEIKKSTSKWIKTQGSGYRNFYWQRGYGMFSVSASRVQNVRNYIHRQERHHQKVNFQEEFRAFLKQYGIGYDERYVWD